MGGILCGYPHSHKTAVVCRKSAIFNQELPIFVCCATVQQCISENQCWARMKVPTSSLPQHAPKQRISSFRLKSEYFTGFLPWAVSFLGQWFAPFGVRSPTSHSLAETWFSHGFKTGRVQLLWCVWFGFVFLTATPRIPSTWRILGLQSKSMHLLSCRRNKSPLYPERNWTGLQTFCYSHPFTQKV